MAGYMSVQEVWLVSKIFFDTASTLSESQTAVKLTGTWFTSNTLYTGLVCMSTSSAQYGWRYVRTRSLTSFKSFNGENIWLPGRCYQHFYSASFCDYRVVLLTFRFFFFFFFSSTAASVLVSKMSDRPVINEKRPPTCWSCRLRAIFARTQLPHAPPPAWSRWVTWTFARAARNSIGTLLQNCLGVTLRVFALYWVSEYLSSVRLVGSSFFVSVVIVMHCARAAWTRLSRLNVLVVLLAAFMY